ncbi:hypothetical protein, conserved in T. vivax [Trypanosoma vivax Y486]|uniref:Uncharacterized protein n=1 Tax=Trypanosoma vivax (strain Y486) TaxID=1055687 RepID=F9WTG3_TRYVY|nr:hypothetical protein, conserved in T. vivax [Trypanosoma vivax Y486]|eukprot:CCD20856.1 hypothetical protein, conserved in T. vivax [Trypanosoma vivax Y486]
MLHRCRGRAAGKCAHNAARHMTGTATEARGGTEEESSHAMVWPQCPTRRTADGERQRGGRQQIARGKWNAKARGKDVRGRGDLVLTIEGGATRAGRSQAAAERRRSVVERRETRGCARGMLTMTAMSRVGKVAVRACSRAAEATCEDVLAGERAVVGELAQSARRVSWCATAIAAQKQRGKTAEAGRRCGDAQSRTTQEGSARASETKCGGIAPAATALARKTHWDAMDKGACLPPPQNATLGPTKVRERRARPCRFCRCGQRERQGSARETPWREMPAPRAFALRR